MKATNDKGRVSKAKRRVIRSLSVWGGFCLGCGSEQQLPGAEPQEHERGSEHEAADSGASPGAVTEPENGAESRGACDTVTSEIVGRVDAVTAGAVILESSAAPRLLYVDAVAGGFQTAASNPYVYVNLEQGARVDETDVSATSTTSWDLAFKRFSILTNGGDSGSGQGKALALDATFDEVTRDNVDLSALQVDDFVDDESCEPLGDGTAAGVFAIWYDYASDTMVLTPRPIVFVVQSGDGQSLYKLQILDYYASAEGGSGLSSGRFRLQYEAL